MAAAKGLTPIRARTCTVRGRGEAQLTISGSAHRPGIGRLRLHSAGAMEAEERKRGAHEFTGSGKLQRPSRIPTPGTPSLVSEQDVEFRAMPARRTENRRRSV